MTQSVRTFIAAFVGVLITRLVGILPAVQEWLSWVDGVFAEAGYPALSALTILESLVVALVILGYQKVAQILGNHWPKIEAILLGSSARPVYMKPETTNAGKRTGSVLIVDDTAIAVDPAARARHGLN